MLPGVVDTESETRSYRLNASIPVESPAYLVPLTTEQSTVEEPSYRIEAIMVSPQNKLLPVELGSLRLSLRPLTETSTWPRTKLDFVQCHVRRLLS